MTTVVSLENVSIEYRRATTKSRSMKQATVEILKGKRKYQTFRALDNVSFEINSGEILAIDRKSTRLNSSHSQQSRMPSSA